MAKKLSEQKKSAIEYAKQYEEKQYASVCSFHPNLISSSQTRKSYIYSTLDNPNVHEVPSEKQHVSES